MTLKLTVNYSLITKGQFCDEEMLWDVLGFKRDMLQTLGSVNTEEQQILILVDLTHFKLFRLCLKYSSVGPACCPFLKLWSN